MNALISKFTIFRWSKLFLAMQLWRLNASPNKCYVSSYVLFIYNVCMFIIWKFSILLNILINKQWIWILAKNKTNEWTICYYKMLTSQRIKKKQRKKTYNAWLLNYIFPMGFDGLHVYIPIIASTFN